LTATVKNWFNKFQRGRTSVFDEPRPGAPKTATTKGNVTKIHDLVLADRRLKIREIAESVGMSKDRVGHILPEILGIRKLSVRWVPRLLTPDNKRNRETTSEQCFITLPPSARPNWSNWATNCYPIDHILQIWPRATSFCFQLEKVTRWTEICVD